MCVCAWMLAPLSLLTCWITPLKSLSPDSAWTLPVCLETSICQSLSCTHTHTYKAALFPPLRLSYLFRLKKCIRSNGTVRCRIQQCHASLHWLLMHCMGCFNVLKLKCEALKNLVWEYMHIYVSDFWFWPAEMERTKEWKKEACCWTSHASIQSADLLADTIRRYWLITDISVSADIFFGGGGLKNIVQEMMLGVICNYCIYYIWSESVSVPAPASIG